MKTEPAAIFKSRQHFIILDGLRGVAAMAVVIFHFMEFVFSDYSKNFIGHGFLAVDFFFCLSGFVIGYAYDERIADIGVWEFFKSRLIRLHPLVIAGTVLGLIGFLADPFSNESSLYSFGKLIPYVLSGLLLIPLPTMSERYLNLFAFDAPAWSLFFEYVANIFYAIILFKINKKYLFVLVVIAAAVLCLVSFHSKGLMGGWSGGTFWDGLARGSFSFLAGLLVYRYGWVVENKLGFTGLAILLFLPFLMPYFQWNWLAEWLVVIIYFPLIVALGAGASLATKHKKFCTFLGDISYPLYMTHYAGIWIFGHYYMTHHIDTVQLILLVIGGLLLLAGFAYLIMRFYDIPVRKYLTEKRKARL